ncbi:NupC/NupG family nucleoside CNT transporter [Lichenicoccus roseus]|uniref:Nucleoside permease n=1 Tax=Lichenicoccus roseus TaxID=2683649 RepID=A0A5R9J7Z5_9PROT|nr:NupC/NupG family nucleoside CNT transporter [Lichenicoccus roseus]TLU73702.1 NupC/NupG family nucleoside CNT transporter [Lichenicoccus roseus]
MPALTAILHGVSGIAVLIAIAVACSFDRRRIRLRTVAAALALQFAIGALILFVPAGRQALHGVSLVVNQVLGYGNDGIEFLFGGLVGPRMFTVFPDGGFVFALRVLPQIIYISALIAVLYYFHIMQTLARILGGALRAVVGTSAIESFSAVTTIFLGQSEMPVAIRPFVALLTRAELFAVMSSGTASVAGSVLAGYAGLGVPIDYLLAASFMAIPGGLLFAKLLLPSSEPSPVTTLDLDFEERRPANVFEAVAIGTTNGVRVAVAVGSMLVAFIGLIACLNGLVGWLGGLAHHPGLSLEGILGWLFAPLAWLIGVRSDLCVLVGGIIGQKIVFNEFVAYVHLSPLIHAHALDNRSLAIASFALCGFANFSSIGILLAGFGSVAPERRAEVSRLGLRAVLAGTLSNLASATIAGMFIS